MNRTLRRPMTLKDELALCERDAARWSRRVEELQQAVAAHKQAIANTSGKLDRVDVLLKGVE